jgi:hypothetical protein
MTDCALQRRDTKRQLLAQPISQHGREGLSDGEVHRAERGPVHALARDHVAAGVHDRDGEGEGSLLCLVPYAFEERKRLAEGGVTSFEKSVHAPILFLHHAAGRRPRAFD